MIRANLLPRPKETFGALGVELDAAYVRQLLLGLTIVIVVALLGIGIEQLHVTRLRETAQTLEAALASHAAERVEAKSLALEVARYQEFARQAALSRRSGPEAAIGVARIGNAVPARAWLDSLGHSDAGYDLSGGAATLDVISSTIVSLGGALPASAATLVSIDNHEHEGVRFDAHLGKRAQTTATRSWNAPR